MQNHWNEIYTNKPQEELGWYQEEPQPDLSLIEDFDLDKNARILVVGAGTSTIIDALLDRGYTNLILADISQVALDTVRNRVGKEGIKYIATDLGQDKDLLEFAGTIDLWYDRAALHFLIEEKQYNHYAKLLSEVLPKRILLAQFSITGADRCSGLPVRQYSEELMQNLVGSDYETVKFEKYTYINPSGGKRPYLYGIFQVIS